MAVFRALVGPQSDSKPTQVLVKPRTFHLYYRGRRGLGLETVAGMTKVLFANDEVSWVPNELIKRVK
jgi:hypothetical protein